MRSIEFDLSAALSDTGTDSSLLDRGTFARLETRISEAMSSIAAKRGPGPLAFLDLPYAYEWPSGIDPFLEERASRTDPFSGQLAEWWPKLHADSSRIREANGELVHLGIGGSALGTILLNDALKDEDSPASLVVPDNVDPDFIKSTFDRLDVSRTFVNVVSKSGNTVETIATFAVLRQFLIDRGQTVEDLRRRIFVTTNPKKGALAKLAASEGYSLIPLHEDIHGRFSVLGPTGLFGAAVAGVEITALLEGARAADKKTCHGNLENPSCGLAAIHFLLNQEKGVNGLVLLPYSNRLKTLADWYSQLVAESLGKNGLGMTPIKALGATDQHSQLQLYIDGPRDKLVVFFAIARHDNEVTIPSSIAASEDYAYLAGRTLNELLEVERLATQKSLQSNGVPSCTFRLDRLDAYSLGYLITILSKAVCILGELYEVDAFDQPGVEESKRLAREAFSK